MQKDKAAGIIVLKKSFDLVKADEKKDVKYNLWWPEMKA